MDSGYSFTSGHPGKQPGLWWVVFPPQHSGFVTLARASHLTSLCLYLMGLLEEKDAAWYAEHSDWMTLKGPASKGQPRSTSNLIVFPQPINRSSIFLVTQAKSLGVYYLVFLSLLQQSCMKMLPVLVLCRARICRCSLPSVPPPWC